MREIYLRGFEICVRESDPLSVMTSYNLLNGTHTSESGALVTALLRDEFGFDGLVMTDWVVGGDLLLSKGSKYGTPDAAIRLSWPAIRVNVLGLPDEYVTLMS